MLPAMTARFASVAWQANPVKVKEFATTCGTSEAVGSPNNVPISEDYGNVTAASFIDPACDGALMQRRKMIRSTCARSISTAEVLKQIHASITAEFCQAILRVRTTTRRFAYCLAAWTEVRRFLRDREWFNAVTSSKSEACIIGAPHAVAQSHQWADAIIADVTSMCH